MAVPEIAHSYMVRRLNNCWQRKGGYAVNELDNTSSMNKEARQPRECRSSSEIMALIYGIQGQRVFSSHGCAYLLTASVVHVVPG